jgi:hypothetical protein
LRIQALEETLAKFKLIVRSKDVVQKDPDDVWRFEQADGKKHKLEITNADRVPHTVEIVNVTHKKTGDRVKPFIGDELVTVAAGQTVTQDIKTVKNSKRRYGTFLYWIVIDDGDPDFDPEIIVDPPSPLIPKKKKARKATPAKKGSAVKSAKRR